MTRSWLLALAATALVAWGAPVVSAAVRPPGAWEVVALDVVPRTATSQSVVAFVHARCTSCVRPLLQLRVCSEGTTACDVGARQEPGADDVTVLRYPRPLAPGRYRVEVLFLDRDALHTSRTSTRATGWVLVDAD